MDPVRTYTFLMRSRARVIDALRPLTDEQYRRAFPFGLVSVGATATHLMLSEWYYFERLAGRDVPPYTAWPIKYECPPPAAEVEIAWSTQQARILGEVERERDWGRVIEYASFPNAKGERFMIRATAGDYMVQLATHETHHRAQIMAMLRMMGDVTGEGVRPLQDIDYNDLMYQRVPIA